MTPNVKNVVIDGLIFAGKTTAISNLKARLSSYQSADTTFNFFEEPVESWMNEGWLEKYYSNISKFASSFQIRIILSHIQQKNEIEEINRGQESKNIVNISERSAITTLNVFSKMLVADGVLDEIEFKLHEQMVEMFKYKKPDMLIYLNIDPEIALRRNLKRMRNGESNIQIEYLRKLNQAYLQDLGNLAENIIVIDGTLDEAEIVDKIMKHLV
jgi:deoxyadenosine/deoxycytidine kinase